MSWGEIEDEEKLEKKRKNAQEMGASRVGVKWENSEEENEEWRGNGGKKQMGNKKVRGVSWEGEKEKK